MSQQNLPNRSIIGIIGLVFLLSIHLVQAQTYVTKAVASGAPDPVILFQFNTPVASTGTDSVVIAKFVIDDLATDLEYRLETSTIASYPITDFKVSQGIVPLNNPETGDPVAELRVRDLTGTESAAPGKRIIKISIKYANNFTFAASEVWKIRAKQPGTGTHHYWGFWNKGAGESTVEATVTKPKLIEFIADGMGNPDVTNFGAFVDFPTTKSISFGEVHINLADALVPQEPYQFINVGTQTLDMVSVNPATMPAGVYGAVNYPGSSSDVLPLAAFTGTLFKCKPTNLGPVPNLSISITVNSSAIPTLNINLIDAVGIRLNTALLIDISGSMNDDIHGNRSVDAEGRPTNDEEVRKIFHAREAGKLVAGVYNELLPDGRFGLFTYPSLAGLCPSSQQVVFLDEIKNNHPTLVDRLDNNSATRIKPDNVYYLTPMAHGIGRVYDALPKEQANNRSIVFMIGDGSHYCDSDPPNRTPADWEPELTSSGIKFYTIPFGDNAASWVAQLEAISGWTHGISYPVNIFDDLDLRKRHENAIRDALDLDQITDPEGNIGRNQRTSHSVCVDQDVYTLTFIVRWVSSAANAASATLLTPEGESITPSTAQTSPNDVGYFSSKSYLGYVVRGRYLRGRAGTGQWKLNLTGSSGLASTQTVRYAYSVYAQTTLKTKYNLKLQYAGLQGVFGLAIGDERHRMRNVAATLEYKAPMKSFGTYLATTPVEPELISRAPDTINGILASLADKKYYALQNFLKKPYNPEYRTNRVEFTQSANVQKIVAAQVAFSGGYSAVLPETNIAGNYELKATIKGMTLRGDCFERELTTVRFVDVNLTAETIYRNTAFEKFAITPFFPKTILDSLRVSPPRGFVRQNLVFTPRDNLGNYWGPGHAEKISFKISGAESLSPIIDNLDGSYIQVVQYTEGTNPSLVVAARGVTSAQISAQTGLQIPWWVWILVLVIVIIVTLIIRRRRQPTP